MQNQTGMDAKAAQFFAALAAGEQPPGGMAFHTAVLQSKLDYSLESLAQLDHLLKQIRQRLKPTREQWQAKPEAANFSLLIAFYLGAMVSRQAKMPIQRHLGGGAEKRRVLGCLEYVYGGRWLATLATLAPRAGAQRSR